MATRLLRGPDVTRKTGLSRTSIWCREKAGTFPRRIRIGPNSVCWSEEEIDSWISEQVSRRDHGQGSEE